RQQGDRRHDLSGLAVAALGDVEPAPGLLDGSRDVTRDALDGDDLAALQRRRGRDARTGGPAVDVDGARAALGDAAAKLRARHPQFVAQHPEQGDVVVGGHRTGGAVDSQTGHRVLQVDVSREMLPRQERVRRTSPSRANDASTFAWSVVRWRTMTSVKPIAPSARKRSATCATVPATSALGSKPR